MGSTNGRGEKNFFALTACWPRPAIIRPAIVRTAVIRPAIVRLLSSALLRYCQGHDTAQSALYSSAPKRGPDRK